MSDKWKTIKTVTETENTDQEKKGYRECKTNVSH